MSVEVTNVKIANVDDLAAMVGDVDPEDIREGLSVVYPFLANCVYSVVVEGNEKTVTFTEKLGTKG